MYKFAIFNKIINNYNKTSFPNESEFTKGLFNYESKYEPVMYNSSEKEEAYDDDTSVDINPFIQESIFAQPAKRKSKGEMLIEQARRYIGNPYVYGGTDPNKGADCSGFIQYMYKQFGINIPRTSHEQGKVGREISLNNVKPGDIVYSSSKNSPSGGHVRMISKVENGQIYTIEARGKKYGIVERPLTNISNIKSIRRLL